MTTPNTNETALKASFDEERKEVVRLMAVCDQYAQSQRELITQRDEAKAEVERLRKELNELRDKYLDQLSGD